MGQSRAWPSVLWGLIQGSLALTVPDISLPTSTSLTTLTSTYSETVTSTITSYAPVTTVQTTCTPGTGFFDTQCTNSFYQRGLLFCYRFFISHFFFVNRCFFVIHFFTSRFFYTSCFVASCFYISRLFLANHFFFIINCCFIASSLVANCFIISRFFFNRQFVVSRCFATCFGVSCYIFWKYFKTGLEVSYKNAFIHNSAIKADFYIRLNPFITITNLISFYYETFFFTIFVLFIFLFLLSIFCNNLPVYDAFPACIGFHLRVGFPVCIGFPVYVGSRIRVDFSIYFTFKVHIIGFCTIHSFGSEYRYYTCNNNNHQHLTACPPSVRDCPASERTTHITTETVAVYTTICPVTNVESKTTLPSVAMTKGNSTGLPSEKLTTSTVYTTHHHTTAVCPSSIHNCAQSQKTTSTATETVIAYVTVCPVSEEGEGKTGNLAATTSPASGEETTNIPTYTWTSSTSPSASAIEDTTITSSTTTGTIPGTGIFTRIVESASAPASDIYISQPSGTNNSATEQSQTTSVGSESSWIGYTSGVKSNISHAITSSAGIAQSASSVRIGTSSSASSTSSAPVAVFTGAAAKKVTDSALFLCVVAVANFLAF
ncbi:uncharacterized protein N7483_005590 [Penicillium malachiteum]|uniref:uncharacterized protein n=1 Tax=Penicillium malachiteum TaxID=1324776 RepID=UPI0025471E23|nr:uncharacterized protein N7483_005590 [Penicillium malachiteum]KAJ5731082.1 hypothetical protein N7483_005590 [Penicillium malachiteum]